MSYDDENMNLCGTFTGASIEEAKLKAAEEFNVDVEKITFKIINDVKKSLFGRIKEEAKVWAGYNIPESEKNVETDNVADDHASEENNIGDQAEYCCKYLKRILDKMGIDVKINLTLENNSYNIEIDSDGSGAVIGRRGETLDALQYLVSLVANKFEGEYKRVTIDSCGYRKKREETLVQLADKIAQKVIKTGKSTTLEPMNPYERRIIHSTISKIEGANSRSVGDEPYRKVVVSSDHPRKGGGYRKKKGEGPRSLDLKTSFEKDYKKPKPEDNINAGLYGKIEI